MKRFVLILVAMMSMSTLSAQMYEKSLAEAQIAYDNAVALSKTAINEARSSERRITSASPPPSDASTPQQPDYNTPSSSRTPLWPEQGGRWQQR